MLYTGQGRNLEGYFFFGVNKVKWDEPDDGEAWIMEMDLCDAELDFVPEINIPDYRDTNHIMREYIYSMTSASGGGKWCDPMMHHEKSLEYYRDMAKKYEFDFYILCHTKVTDESTPPLVFDTVDQVMEFKQWNS